MRRMIATIAATVAMVSVHAADTYHGFANGNPDLHPDRVQTNDMVGVQPGVGDSTAIYRGFQISNDDLFSGSVVRGGGTHSDPGVYGGFRENNPDLW